MESDYTCQRPGCDRSPFNGWAIFRTSPKGGPFEGLCGEHYRQEFNEMLEDLAH